VGLAVLTGVAHTVWLEDPAAITTAYRHLQRIAEARNPS
jgi:hypothetical protein